MKIQGSSPLSYAIRHFSFFLPITVAPSLLLALSCTSYDSVSFISFLVNLVSNTGGFQVRDFFNDVYRYYSIINTSSFFWVWLAGLLVALVCLCFSFCATERHMRLGVLTYPSFRGSLNDTVIPVCSYFLCLVLFFELCNLICCGVISLLISLGVGGSALLVLVLVVTLLFFIIILTVISMSLCTIPSRLFDRYKFNVALSYSIQLVGANFGRTLLYTMALLVPAVGVRIVASFAYAVTQWFNAAFYFIIMFIYYTFMMSIIPPFCLSNYMKLTNGSRKDLKELLF